MSEESVFLHDKEFVPFLSKAEIKEAVKNLAEAINKDFEGKEIVVVGVLDGAFMVLSDLLKKLKLNVSLELVKFKSYEGTTSSGRVNKLMGLTSSLKDKEVLIVEDIVDTGRTLTSILDLVKSHQPKSLKIVTLLLKKDVFKDRLPIDYYGIDIPDRFVVGYGMDFNGQGRQLRSIYAAKEELA